MDNDVRRCALHGQALQSNDGLHDTPCTQCEAAIETADDEPEPKKAADGTELLCWSCDNNSVECTCEEFFDPTCSECKQPVTSYNNAWYGHTAGSVIHRYHDRQQPILATYK